MESEILINIIDRLKNDADEALDDYEQTKSDFSNGRRTAFYEVLDSIKNKLYSFDINPDDYGLGADLDKKYL